MERLFSLINFLFGLLAIGVGIIIFQSDPNHLANAALAVAVVAMGATNLWLAEQAAK
jgi:hypothetical protein